jgi:hypothetical protein
MSREAIDLKPPQTQAQDANKQVAAFQADVAAWNKQGACRSQYAAQPGRKLCAALIAIDGDYITDEEYNAVVTAMVLACPRIIGVRVASRVECPPAIEGYETVAHAALHVRYENES